MALIDAILQELDWEARSTRRLLERVPESRLEWRPHTKSRTLGQLAMHIALVPGAIARLATAPSRFRLHLRELDVPLPSIFGPSADESPFA